MRNLWSPASFRGGRKKRDYFEGWHFKHSGGIDEGVEFDLSDGTSRISGAFAYGGFSIPRFPFWSPGVMDLFTFMPGMEIAGDLLSMAPRKRRERR